MKNTLILMTALIPTTGHTDLISFAASMADTNVYVLINGRTFEPVSSLQRQQSLAKHFRNQPKVTIQHRVRDNAPQNALVAENSDTFWNYWKNEVSEAFPGVKFDYVVASENYGQQLALTVGAAFVPYDIARTFSTSQGTVVRNDLWENWDKVIPEFRESLLINAVMFGQESVGKTTVSRLVAESLNVQWFPEYARPYLETVGANVTLDAMGHIHMGQKALQKIARHKSLTPANVFDTDLFSTVGYYDIMLEKVPQECINDAIQHQAQVYYLLPDDIPFVEDELRYGGDRRESDRTFWVNILQRYGLNYIHVPSGSAESKAQWISSDIRAKFAAQVKEIKEFTRD